MRKGPHPLLAAVNRAIAALETGSMALAAAAMLAMMLIIVTDVAARYIFKSPLPWSFDFISLYLMPAAFFLALSDTLHKEHHVNVDIVLNAMSLRVVYAMKGIGSALAIVLFVGMAYAAALRTWDAYTTADVTSGVIQWPTWVSTAFVVLGAGLLLLRGLFRAVAFTLATFARNGGIPGIKAKAYVEEEL